MAPQNASSKRKNIINNRYVLQAPLGVGGMGAVFKTLDRLTGETIALKHVRAMQPPPDGSTHTNDGSDARIALSTEFRTLASLRHPNIITVIDYGFDTNQQPYFTMSLLEDAHSIVMASRNLPIEGKVQLLTQMLHALSYLHRRTVIHRDLKPANVLVLPDHRVKVLDFGIALNESRTMANLNNVTVGTIAYMAPELLIDRPATVESDLYAVGIIAYQMFAGAHPYDIKNMANLINSVMKTEPNLNVLDHRVAQVVGRLLAKTPKDRYHSAEDVISEFANALKTQIPIEDAAIRDSILNASKFVGREGELNQLRDALRDLTHSTEETAHQSAWIIAGESGVGKSRLVDEVRIRALVRGVKVLRGQCTTDNALPYQPFVAPLRSLILAVDVDPDEASVLKEIIPDIGDLLEREIELADPLEGVEGRARLIETILMIFRKNKQPTLFIVEDLHWADETLTILRMIIERLDDVPLMVIGTYRDDEKPEVSERLPTAQVMRLGRLPESAIAELSESILGKSGKRRAVLDYIKRETEGNVFFIVEVIRALAEDAGSLSDIGTKEMPEHILSGGIQQVIQRRLDSVPENARLLLKFAAIIGRQIDLALMQTLDVGGTSTDAHSELLDVDEWLTICVNTAVLNAEDGRWRFAHDKLREGVLNSFEPNEKQTLYKKVAEATEAVYGDAPERVSSLVDYWREAANPLKELAYVRVAADHARRINAFRETTRHTTRAIALLEERKTEQDWQEQVAELRIQLGEAYGYLGDFNEARKHLRQSADISRQIDDRQTLAQALNALGDIDQDQGEYDAATRNHKISLKLFREIGDMHGATNALTDLGRTAQSLGKYAGAKARYHEALRICRENNNHNGIVECLGFLGNVSEQEGKFDEANKYYEEALAIIRNFGDYSRIAGMLDNLGNISQRKGDFPAAQIYFSESLTIYRRINNELGAALVLGNLGNIALQQMNIMTALAYCEESLEIFRQIGNRLGMAFSLNSLGNIALAEEKIEIAREHYQEALQICQDSGVRGGIATGYSHLAWVEEKDNDYFTAREYYRSALAIHREMGDREKTARVLISMAFTEIALDNLTPVEGLLQTALEIATQIDFLQVILKALLGYAHLEFANNHLQRSAELVGLVSQDIDLNEPSIKRRMEPLLKLLETAMPADDLVQALEHGRASLNLEDIRNQLLHGSSTS